MTNDNQTNTPATPPPMTHYPPSVADLLHYQESANIRNDKAWSIMASSAEKQGPTQLLSEYAMMCDSLGKLVREDRPLAVFVAKSYVEYDMKHRNQLACGDQEFNHARLMYQEKRAGWMMSAVLTTLIACGAISAIFFVLSEMTKVAS